jgi:hypothetical protein
MKALTLLIFWGILLSFPSSAQNYSATLGSNYAGNLGVINNPSSIVNSPYKWDVTLVGTQYHTATNTITATSHPSFITPATRIRTTNGDFKRYFEASEDLRLLNARIALSRQRAIAFGVNFRSGQNMNVSRFAYYDSLRSTSDFLMANERTDPFSGKATASGWVEIFATYAQTISDNDFQRVNAGITVKAMRGLAGVHVEANNVDVRTVPSQANEFDNVISSGDVRYLISANLDNWRDERSTRDNLRDVVSKSRGSIAVDIGVEYILKGANVTSMNDDDESYFDYDWKIGIALLDLGFNQFTSGNNSARVSAVKDNITGGTLNQKFSGIDNLSDFNDSIATIVDDFSGISGEYRINTPARLVINADRYISGNFFVNGNLTINLNSTGSENRLSLRQSDFITLTPRWERSNFGVYMPVQINRHGRMWIGAAAKAGPLLFGFHNLFSIFAGNKQLNGGGYLALVIRPFKSVQGSGRGRGIECPDY